jgi:membrane fusion protein, multidrug efflux system
MSAITRRCLLALALGLVAGSACDSDDGGGGGGGGGGGPPGQAQRGPRPFPVQVAAVGHQGVDYTVNGVGTVDAFERIQVTARVTGVVEKVSFSEGQTVKAGQPLIEIEPRRYELAVASARATLKKAEAAAAEARAGLERRESATRDNPGLIPGEEVETWRTKVATAEAEVAAAQVALQRAELDRRDAHVRAPVAGVLQTRTVDTGQYVQPGAVLATLVKRDPLLLRFEVPQIAAARMQPGMTVQFTGQGNQEPFSARVTLVSTAADPSSRLVPITAVIEDPRAGELQPGAFARVTVKLGRTDEAIVIPQTAVRASEKGFLAYVVVDGKAEERVVELGMRTADGMVEVKQGVAVGEELVVRGAEALRPGAPVLIQPADGAPATTKAAAGAP